MAIELKDKIRIKRLEIASEGDVEKKAKLQAQLKKLLLKQQLQNLNK
jgi:hypothetical protein